MMIYIREAKLSGWKAEKYNPLVNHDEDDFQSWNESHDRRHPWNDLRESNEPNGKLSFTVNVTRNQIHDDGIWLCVKRQISTISTYGLEND